MSTKVKICVPRDPPTADPPTNRDTLYVMSKGSSHGVPPSLYHDVKFALMGSYNEDYLNKPNGGFTMCELRKKTNGSLALHVWRGIINAQDIDLVVHT